MVRRLTFGNSKNGSKFNANMEGFAEPVTYVNMMYYVDHINIITYICKFTYVCWIQSLVF